MLKKFIGATLACTMIFALFTSLALAETYNEDPQENLTMEQQSPKTSRLSPENEGADVPIVLSPGRTLEEAKQFIKEADRQSRKAILNKDEKKLLQQLQEAEKQAKRDSRDFAAEPAGISGNSFSGADTRHGGILLGYDAGNAKAWCAYSISGYCHAGIWNNNYYFGSLSDAAIRTANTDRGIKYEDAIYWRHFQEVREMKVIFASAADENYAVAMANTYSGPYSIASTKYSNDQWYCSKVVWRAYWDASRYDIDGDGGLFVAPGDIRWSPNTSSVKVWY
ncbi:hypothetical protein [Paenibacillus elgii]|uniref:hypothetical protein n=1 Tax=Paenibacillus elgii TaxID=189691 RepID=UPI000248CC92|nr:hypothetical protein [Paenibacillus elgii]